MLRLAPARPSARAICAGFPVTRPRRRPRTTTGDNACSQRVHLRRRTNVARRTSGVVRKAGNRKA
eukprot:172130-Lingulodinium_polyedra.AAC.1